MYSNKVSKQDIMEHIHSPREIISTAGKTGHDARWKRKQS